MPWMSYLAVSDFTACPDPICSQEKMLCCWRHPQWQQGIEKLNPLGSDEVLPSNMDFDEEERKKRIFVIVS